MGKRRTKFGEYILANADASAFGGPKREGDGSASVRAYFKGNQPGLRYRVANEFISATLGRFIGLPIPPCGIVTAPGSGHWFATLDFDLEREYLLPVSPEACMRFDPRLCTGIVLFDVLIANEDRHDENLKTDNQASPSRLVVYDHDVALFGGNGQLRGIERLESLKPRLGITGGPITGGNAHCLLPALDTTRYFSEWLRRVYQIPDWFIAQTCDELVKIRQINRKEADAAADFLDYRRKHLDTIIGEHRAAFPAIQQWNPSGELPSL